MVNSVVLINFDQQQNNHRIIGIESDKQHFQLESNENSDIATLEFMVDIINKNPHTHTVHTDRSYGLSWNNLNIQLKPVTEERVN